MTVVFFVSGHGFGHASRQVEVINALAEARPGCRLIVRTSVSPVLLKRTLRTPVDLRPGPCDTGVIQTTSVAHDDEATVREAIGFHRTLAERAAGEADALRSDHVNLVVGDIPPLAFEVAAQLGVPSLAIANFTWDWVYEPMPGLDQSAPWLLPAIRSAYARATLALELPFSGGFEVFPASRKIPWIARHPVTSRSEVRARLGLPEQRRVALLSFGGYGLPSLDLTRLDCLNEWTIVSTDRLGGDTQRLPKAIRHLPEDDFFASGLQYPDLVGAVDVVITKPGFGIVAECIACGPSLLYTSRGQFREYDLFVERMPDVVRCRFIDHEALFAGRWQEPLNALMQQPAPPTRPATNGAQVAAAAIVSLLS